MTLELVSEEDVICKRRTINKKCNHINRYFGGYLWDKVTKNIQEHHIRYQEIDGIDKTIMVTPLEHKNLHSPPWHVPNDVLMSSRKRKRNRTLPPGHVSYLKLLMTLKENNNKQVVNKYTKYSGTLDRS